MKSWKRTVSAGVCAVALLSGAAPASADEVVNRLDNSIDDTWETMRLTVGAGAVSTNIYVDPAQGDGVNGCNIKGGDKLVLNVQSSNTGVATVTSSIEITGCGTENQKPVSVMPVAAGTSDITFTKDNNATTASGSFDVFTARFRADVAPASSPPASSPPPPSDTTAPTWSCNPAAASSDWQATEGSHSCTASDPSGLKTGSPASFTLSTSVGGGNENDAASTNSQQLCDVHDNCTTAGPIAGWKVDRKAPAIADNGPTTSPNAAGWYNSDVTNAFSASDGGSGLASGASSTIQPTTTGEGTAVTVSSGAVADAVGNSNPGTNSAAFKIDMTRPDAPNAAATTGPGYTDASGNEWWQGSVTVGFTDNGDPELSNGDPGSGVDATTLSVPLEFTTTGPHTASGTVKDNAGNESDAGTLGVHVDATNPTAVFTDCPSSPVLFGSSHTATWSASDDGSGLKSADTGSVALDTTSVGPNKTVSGPAPVDNVDNTGTAPSCGYSVVYSSTGILQPINSDNSSVFKIKSTVPVKIQLTNDSAGFTNGVFNVSLNKVSSGVVGSDNEPAISTSAHTGTTMRYDSTSNQYIFNLGTSKLASGTYQVTVTLDDGTTRKAQFGLRS